MNAIRVLAGSERFFQPLKQTATTAAEFGDGLSDLSVHRQTQEMCCLPSDVHVPNRSLKKSGPFSGPLSFLRSGREEKPERTIMRCNPLHVNSALTEPGCPVDDVIGIRRQLIGSPIRRGGVALPSPLR